MERVVSRNMALKDAAVATCWNVRQSALVNMPQSSRRNPWYISLRRTAFPSQWETICFHYSMLGYHNNSLSPCDCFGYRKTDEPSGSSSTITADFIRPQRLHIVCGLATQGRPELYIREAEYI